QQRAVADGEAAELRQAELAFALAVERDGVLARGQPGRERVAARARHRRERRLRLAVDDRLEDEGAFIPEVSGERRAAKARDEAGARPGEAWSDRIAGVDAPDPAHARGHPGRASRRVVAGGVVPGGQATSCSARSTRWRHA